MPKSPRSAPNAVRVIDVLTYPTVQLLDVTGPSQVFASATDLLTGTGGARTYVLRVDAQNAFGPNLHPHGAAGYDAKADLAVLKSEIAAVKAELKADIAGLKIDLKDAITRLKDDMHKWVVGALGFQTVVILGALVSLAMEPGASLRSG